MLPIVARTFFRLHERLLGRPTFRLLRELEESQWWPREQMEALQAERLRDLLATAYAHTPYWREVMDARALKPYDIQDLDDLQRLPLLEKETIRARREEMVWREADRRVRLVRTSGSTNAALEFYTSAKREAHITAGRMRGHRWVGIDPGDKEMYFWAAPVELGAQDRIKGVRDWLRNDGFTSALNLSHETVRHHVAKWARWRPQCLFGYVSSFVLLVRLAREQGLDLRVLNGRGLRAIVTTSEILGANREAIEEGFGVPVYDSYGLREAGFIGHECEERTLHVTDEQVILETVAPTTLEPTSGEGELVVTMLASHCMPVIRYRTGDVVSLSGATCPCGRGVSSLRISGGRLMEFIVTGSGRWISCVAFIYVCREIPGVLQIQARQHHVGEVRVLVAPGPDFPADGVEQVKKAVRARLADDDTIRVELVDEIPPAPSGKQRIVISDVARSLLCPGSPEAGAGSAAPGPPPRP